MTFDKNEKTIFIALACAVIIASGVYIWHSRLTLNATGREQERLAAQIASLKARLQTSESGLAQAKADWNDERAATTDKESSTMASASAVRAAAMQNAFMERVKNNDPKYLKVYQKALQINIDTNYGAFFAKEHLTPDQTDKLRKSEMQRLMDKTDLAMALASKGLAPNDPSGQPISQQSDDTFQKAVEDVIGSEGYARFQTYQAGIDSGARQMMSAYAAESALIGSPMTPDQVDQMVDFITKTNPDYQEGKPPNPLKIDWDAVDEQAHKIMTPEQYDMFINSNPLGTPPSRWAQKINRALSAAAEEAKKQYPDPPAPAK